MTYTPRPGTTPHVVLTALSLPDAPERIYRGGDPPGDAETADQHRPGAGRRRPERAAHARARCGRADLVLAGE